MMIEILILSLIQGIAEFLPISSSSHLILASEFLNFKNQSLELDVSLHIGSLIAVLVYFFKDLKDFVSNRKLFFKIIISSIPVMIIGFFLVKTDLIQKLRNVEVIAWTTLIFGALLYISDKFKLDKNLSKNFSFKNALIIGMFQILSLIPGVSRSGITITAARLLDFNRVDSAKISFLLSIPTLSAVSIFGVSNIFHSQTENISYLSFTSIIFSFLISFLTIKYFLIYLKKFSLKIFVAYRMILGIILLFLVYL